VILGHGHAGQLPAAGGAVPRGRAISYARCWAEAVVYLGSRAFLGQPAMLIGGACC